MPDWIIAVFGILMVIGLGLISWVWWQALLNVNAASERPLRVFARIKLIRETILWMVQASATGAYAIVVVFPSPRSDWLSLLFVLFLLTTTGGVTLLSIHDFREMREFFGGE